MRIIQAHKYYSYRDGASNYALDWAQTLRQRGQVVAPFAMQGKNNLSSAWNKYFISETDLQNPKWSPGYLAKAAGRFFYSFEARRQFTKLCEAFKPDLLHVHNLYHHLSASILDETRARHLPVIMTLHDYALLNPNYSLFVRNKIYAPQKHRGLRAVFNRAVNNSIADSCLSALGFSWERWRRVYERSVDYFIAPTRFVKDLFVSFGWEAKRIRVVPYFVPLGEKINVGAGYHQPYFLYAGRLSLEKGVVVLLQALSTLPPECYLKIIGDGPDKQILKSLAIELGVASRVEFLGYLPRQVVWPLMAGALAVCVPSLWYEVFGLVALEAMAQGVPVLASKIGGLPEVVRDGGWLLPPSDIEAWREKMLFVLEHGLEVDQVAKRAAVRASEFTVDRHYQTMMGIYQRAKKQI